MRYQLASKPVVGLGAGPLDWLSEIGLSIRNAVGAMRAPRRSNRALTAHRPTTYPRALLAGPPRQLGMGAVNLQDAALQAAAQTLYTKLQQNGCQPVYDQDVFNFQQAFVSAGGVLPQDTGGRNPEDGLYGTNTSNALRQIYPDALPGCVGAASAITGPASAAVSTALGPSNPVSVYFADVMGGGQSLWWTLGIVGLVGIAVWADAKEKHKRRPSKRKSQRRPKRRPSNRRGRKGRKSRRGRRRR